MRMIGHLRSEPDARAFGDYLYVHGVENQVEPEREGSWAVWVHSEDEVEKARLWLQDFVRNPNASHFHVAREEAHRKRKEEQELKSAAGKRMFGAEDVFGGRLIWGMGRITALLVGISVVIWILYQIPSVRPYFGVLSITQQYIGLQSDRWTKGLEEVRRGEVWRLITQIFIHVNLL